MHIYIIRRRKLAINTDQTTKRTALQTGPSCFRPAMYDIKNNDMTFPLRINVPKMNEAPKLNGAAPRAKFADLPLPVFSQKRTQPA